MSTQNYNNPHLDLKISLINFIERKRADGKSCFSREMVDMNMPIVCPAHLVTTKLMSYLLGRDSGQTLQHCP